MYNNSAKIIAALFKNCRPCFWYLPSFLYTLTNERSYQMFICLPDKTCRLNKIFMPVFSWLNFTWHSSKWPISWVKYDTITAYFNYFRLESYMYDMYKKDFNNHELILKEKFARIRMHYVFVILKSTDICNTPITLW